MKTANIIIDVQVENHGTVYTFEPLTDTAREWIEANVQAESWAWIGNKLSVDHRYAQGLYDLMQMADLVVR
jgi:hypothetical protein